MRLKSNNVSGFTLVEMAAYAAVLSVVMVFIPYPFRYIHQLTRNQNTMHTQQQAQLVMDILRRDIRNSRKICQITPSTLVINTYPTHLAGDFSFDNNKIPQLFDWVAVGTTTYIYSDAVAPKTGGCLKRIVERFGKPQHEDVLIDGQLMAFDATRPMFSIGTLVSGPEITGVQIKLPLSDHYSIMSNSNTYEEEVYRIGTM